MKHYKVGLVGATSMLSQKLVANLANHPWFEIGAMAASSYSAGKTYEQAINGRWILSTPVPDAVKGMRLYDANTDITTIASKVDFIIFTMIMNKDEAYELEQRYATAGCPVISNNSAARFANDIPMIVPELNVDHLKIIEHQKRRLNSGRGFIVSNLNCAIQNILAPLYPLINTYGVDKALVCTYQAISGAGKTFATWPEMVDNVIPYIGGEEEKFASEPLKVFGSIVDNQIVSAHEPLIASQCIRVPISEGHTSAVFLNLKQKASKEEIIRLWQDYKGAPQELGLPTAPKHYIHYFTDDNRPQAKFDRNTEEGMSVCIGRLREDQIFDYKFISLASNTERGGAKGALLIAELLCALDYI